MWIIAVIVLSIIIIIIWIFCLPKKNKKSIEPTEDLTLLAKDARDKIVWQAWQESIEKSKGGK